MRWFRFYDEVLNDRKVQRLSPHLFKTWVNLLCLASKSGGKLPCDDDIAYDLRISVHDASQQVEDLILAGLIDIGPRGERTPHNWSNRQYVSDSSAERTRKYRENRKKKSSDVTPDVTVTVQNQSQNRKEEDSPSSSTLPYTARGEVPKREEQGFDSGLAKGKGEDGKAKTLDTLTRRAEGLGLPVEDLTAVVNDVRPRNRSAYFTKLCVNRLQPLLPRIPEAVIRDALWGKQPAYGVVCEALLVGAAS